MNGKTAVFTQYLTRLAETPVENQTEHTGRAALEELLRGFAARLRTEGLRVQHEPGRQEDGSAPDFAIWKDGRIVGYVEVKPVGSALDPVLRSDQIRRYRSLCDNILVTNYLEFVWLRDKGVLDRGILAFPTDLEARRIRRPAPERAESVARLVEGFLSVAPERIGRARDLALALAPRTRLLRDELTRELTRQKQADSQGRLHGLYSVFRERVFHQLEMKEFADAFAQMLTYGLFLARLNAPVNEAVTLETARAHIPGSFALIRELVLFLDTLAERRYRRTRWIVEEILSIVNGIDLRAIHEDLAFRDAGTRRFWEEKDPEEVRLFARDPFIYFYEDFLAKYDAALKKKRGVYYTPPPVVSFIVRAIDDILKRDFDLPQGLAAHERVTVLDFACGTGTFLLEVFARIFANIGGPGAGMADAIVREHLLRNIYGFEYLLAPYTIAHLKLSQYLAEAGHPLGEDERLAVYLTNTLEPIKPQDDLLLPAVSEEVKRAQQVKDRPILVILGNPPYAGHSKNKGQWITRQVKEYRYVHEPDEKGRLTRRPLGERNPKWLQDDYVKFLRFAQWKMDQVEEGIVGVITNHSWIDNPTFRGMRESLMRSFDRIHVLDLHGNAKKKERAPDGGKDENVFDIEQGVAITLFVKKPGLRKGVFHADLRGRRTEKYQRLLELGIRDIPWRKAEPHRRFFSLFLPLDYDLLDEYASGFALPDIFHVHSVGITTARDHLTIHFTREELMETVRRFAELPPEDARREFHLGRDAQDWKVEDAQRDVTVSGPSEECATPIAYRPFDLRWTYYTGRAGGFICRPRQSVMRHMLKGQNVALITARKIDISEPWSHVLCASNVIDHHFASTKEVNYLFPLFVTDESCMEENLSPEFRSFLDARYGRHAAAEDIFGCIYAILHAPGYRRRYRDFLRIDFPRIPFPERAEDFETLSKLGWRLVEVHLLRVRPGPGLARLEGRGADVVEEVRYDAGARAIRINDRQVFAPVPPEVWNFTIGGHRVLERFLTDRTGRRLSLAEITHVGAVADALAFTREQMTHIDAAWRKAFPDRA